MVQRSAEAGHRTPSAKDRTNDVHGSVVTWIIGPSIRFESRISVPPSVCAHSTHSVPLPPL